MSLDVEATAEALGWKRPQGAFPAQATTTVDSAPLRVVTAEQFAAVEEEGATALLGDEEAALIPEGCDVVMFGDGGAGKTTLCVDLACHLAAGDDWLGITVARPVRVLLLENEGPRPLLRKKVERKLASWDGSPLQGCLLVLEEPWACFTFSEPGWRDKLAATIRSAEIDVVIVGPLTAVGMEDAGTIPQAREFASLLAAVRGASGRPVAFLVVHHENKAGQVSGAWEGVGDGLFHVLKRGHGRTGLHFRKARWSSAHHGKTLELLWADGESFTVDERDEISDEALRGQILDFVRDHPGVGWGKVEKATDGQHKRKRDVRDGLLAAGTIVNIGKLPDGRQTVLNLLEEGKRARLHVSDDPTIQHLCPAGGTVGAQGHETQDSLDV